MNPGRSAFVLVLIAGLALRLAILWQTPGLGTRILDENDYVRLAASILAGDGFAWSAGEPTSLRPPAYPALVALVWAVAGEGNLQAVRLVQFALGLLLAVVTFELGRRLHGPAVGAAAASVVWLYPTLVFLNVTILTETLFTLFLTAFVLLAVLAIERPRPIVAFACGVTLGLGALTRSVLWPLPLVFCPLLAWLMPGGTRQRLGLAMLTFVGYSAVVAPWTVRNTRLQGVFTVVDTMGGLNLRMGNYEHTPENRMWDAVSMRGERSWVYAFTQESHAGPVTEGTKDKWAMARAFEFMAANPAVTTRRALIKFADFWGLERTFIAGIQQGLYSPPAWFAVAAAAATLIACAALLLLGSAGAWLAPANWRANLLLLLPVGVLTAAHTLTFGHPRYHVPLVPILAVYASALCASPRARWARAGWRRSAALVTAATLIAIWLRQLALEFDKGLSFLGGLGS